MRSYLDILNEAPARGLSSKGGLVNFNVDKSLPITKIKDKDGKVFDLYASEEDAQKFIDGSNAYEKFDSSKAQDVSGGNEKLDAIVKKYAKPGMSVADIAAAEKEAGSDSNSRYVLAYMAKALGLEGMYRADGSAYVYLDGDEVKSAAGGNMDQALDVAKKGILPDAVKSKVEKVTNSSREDVAAKAKEVIAATGEGTDYTAKIKAAQELLAKAVAQETEESFRTLSYADQLLEQLSGREAQELAAIMKELEDALPNITDASQKQQIEALMNQYKEFQAGGAGDSAEKAPEQQIDTDSDSAIAAAIKDPALWIKNEMPKELKQANANGLLKATERGKKKSASAAAVQQIMKQIASVTGNKDMDIDADGLYGPASIAAVKKAQQLAGIKVDGDPGAQTAAELVKFAENPTADGGIADTDLNQDLDKAIEILDKGIAAFGTTQTASTDFTHLLAIVEGKLKEALSPEDTETLKGIVAELEPKLNDPEYMAAQDPEMQAKFKAFQDKRKQYNDLVAKDQEAQKAIPGEMFKAVRGMGTDEEAVYAAIGKISSKGSFDTMIKNNPTLIPEVLDDFSGNELNKVIGLFKNKGIDIQVVKNPGMMGGGEYKYDGKTYTAKSAPAGMPDESDPTQDAGGQQTQQPRVGSTNPAQAVPPGGQQQQNQSKEYDMSKKLNEASMNISMNGESAAEVAELVGILKNAGMPDAKPVTQMDMPPMDSHDDMKSMMMKVQGPEESPCGCGESPCGCGEGVEEDNEYSNSPDETYGTADQQMIDLSRDSGVNAPKKMSKKPSWHSGDNPMETTSIKDELMKALAEKKASKEIEEGPGKEKGLDGKACWDGYKIGNPKTKMKNGKRVDNCVPMSSKEKNK